MVIVIHLRKVDHVVDAGNVDNNSVFEDIVRRQEQNQRQQYHRNLLFLLFCICLSKNERRSKMKNN
jgi:hypothetical protein